MKRYLILSMLVIMVLSITVGCSKGVKEKDEKTGKDRTSFTCIKNGIERNNTISDSYTLSVKEVAKIDDDGKLQYYSSTSTYTMKSKEECVKSCETATKWNDEINAKKHSGAHRVTTCKCDEKEYSEEHIYDDIPNLDKFLRSDIQHLKDDNTFDLDGFISHYEKYGYNCN